MSKQKETMDSRELGLVLGQQLLGVDDMHYGMWDDDLELKFANIATAQQRYTDMLIADMPDPGQGEVRVFDIGCGTGHILGQLLDHGFKADGLVPAPGFAKLVNQRLDERPGKEAKLFTIPFEEFPVDEFENTYDVALFSESFQYIPVEASFPILEKIVKPGGTIIICDFFRTEHAGDGGAGDGSFGGGHDWKTFQQQMSDSPFELVSDEDITPKMSPNLELVNNFLMNTLSPAGQTIGRYLRLNYPKTSKVVSWLFRKKFARLKFKYFSGLRSKETFERYKTYHHIVLRNPAN
ncbi:MAG: methyltransferase domain-containing protein [Gammaproteobacteria bacterium]|nr:methyltransferase domain-containing protein [Gammaproteobacteria bacterium]